MAGTIIERQLTAPASSAVRFVLATREDDAASAVSCVKIH